MSSSDTTSTAASGPDRPEARPLHRVKKPKPAEEEQQHLLLETGKKVYPRAVTGLFARWRWAMVFLTQIVFYGLPWLNWNDRQAVLFDLGTRKFHIFGLVLYPQDFIYLTALLVISAMSLFLFTTVAGRLWCGYTCPQTVYTEIFLWIERKIEGDRNKRMKFDKSPASFRKYRIKATKHAVWIAFSLFTGFTFVGYFTPIRELAVQMAAFSLGPWQAFWVFFYGFATYGNAGFLREQVCKYMCPYARFQGVMVDRDTLVITYDEKRGEPRGARSKKADPATLNLGDCVNCNLCVQVCPTGIDIRDGQQYECIGCAACIDVCNQVMEKVGYPKGLVRYDTLNNMESGGNPNEAFRHLLRPRVFLYSGIILTVVTALLFSLGNRIPLKVDIMRDRGTLSREVKNGMIENVFRINLINSAEVDRVFTLEVQGMNDITIDTETEIAVESASHRLIPVRVRANPEGGKPGSNSIDFIITAKDDPSVQRVEEAPFFLPRR
ncbi:MAG: cytochrome c oxidase accessory protein CcoG [Gammaproteobacteria bacterium]|nr:MAG: cytochrome c oxidase accessory protein CcoG [Gammaproteobacteria bacterium]